ncbi:MAG: DNA-binding protein [Ignavibacteria bacterium]
MKEYKIGFLCSRKVPAEIILKTYDWAIEQREKGNCVMSGFHSKIEKDVFHYLNKGDQPIIIVLARSLKQRWEDGILEGLEKNKLLVISTSPNVNRITQESSSQRNKFIVENCDELVVGYANPKGKLSKLLNSCIKPRGQIQPVWNS